MGCFVLCFYSTWGIGYWAVVVEERCSSGPVGKHRVFSIQFVDKMGISIFNQKTQDKGHSTGQSTAIEHEVSNASGSWRYARFASGDTHLLIGPSAVLTPFVIGFLPQLSLSLGKLGFCASFGCQVTAVGGPRYASAAQAMCTATLFFFGWLTSLTFVQAPWGNGSKPFGPLFFFGFGLKCWI